MTAATDLRSAAWHALDGVFDPELDRPITDLGFVAELTAAEDEIRATLRLPTYFCAPNFAYLMVADAHEALTALAPRVRVRLVDHFAADEINAGVSVGDGFDAAFSGLADGELDELRCVFLRKAHEAQQEKIASKMLGRGYTHEQLVRMRLGELEHDAMMNKLRGRRRQLGLPRDEDAPLLIDQDGRPLELETLPKRLRFARTTRVSIEANTDWCTGLLATRYPESEHSSPDRKAR